MDWIWNPPVSCPRNGEVWQTLVWRGTDVVQVNVAVRDIRTANEVAITTSTVGPFDSWAELLVEVTTTAIDSARPQLSEQLLLFD